MLQRKPIIQFWHEIRITLLIVSAIFITGILLGLVLPPFIKIWLIQSIADKFNFILRGTDSIWSLWLTIFINNFVVAFILFTLSVFIFLPIIILLSNGLIIGVFLDLIYNYSALEPGSFFTSIASLIPHGIFEIPAFLLSATLGINLLLKLIFGQKILSKQNRKQALKSYFKRYIILIVPLMMLAAFFEVTISIYLIDSLSKHYQDKYYNENLAVELSNDFLVEHQCHVASDRSQATGSLVESITEMDDILYDKEALAIFKRTSRMSHWQQAYQCQDNLLKISTYPKYRYSEVSATQDQQIILEKLDYNITQQNNNIFIANDHKNQLYYFITESLDKTIITFWDGDNDYLLTNIKSLL